VEEHNPQPYRVGFEHEGRPCFVAQSGRAAVIACEWWVLLLGARGGLPMSCCLRMPSPAPACSWPCSFHGVRMRLARPRQLTSFPSGAAHIPGDKPRPSSKGGRVWCGEERRSAHEWIVFDCSRSHLTESKNSRLRSVQLTDGQILRMLKWRRSVCRKPCTIFETIQRVIACSDMSSFFITRTQ
jgi:hypothetical protein